MLPRRALSLRQPWAELVLRGEKTLEVRSRNTHIRGEVLIYAAKNRIEASLERELAQKYGFDPEALPRGLVVGVVEIVGSVTVTPDDSPQACFEIEDDSGDYGWQLRHAKRLDEPFKPKRHPQPSFFFAYDEGDQP